MQILLQSYNKVSGTRSIARLWAMVRARTSTSGSIPKSRYFVHAFGFALATHACVNSIAPNLRPSFFFTPQPHACSCCLLALLARCLLFYTVLRPHLGLAGPTKAPSALRLMQLQTSNSYFVSPTASLENGGGSPSPSNLTPPLPETVTVCILFLPPSRRPSFGCPSHCQFSSLWAACRTQQLT
ncbi:hypothetical protein CCUS01_16572 [Colletotrichum cuscutae]|uniref:Uncharacterized protein n=1 Tax=Colletotrichum cuscutae TaxID=1209917 RepID=A0AAI9V937_9PEZI|nr:hypothetical protein CCUS01_16572 [Colletotrichum cuscutae]